MSLSLPTRRLMLSGEPSLLPETLALLARMSNPPGSQRRKVINRLIKSLKDGGIWAKLDLFYMYAAHDSQAARLNWPSTNYTATSTASPIFTADRGYQGDGAAAYLKTGYAPSSFAPGMTLNDAHYGALVLAESTGNPDFGAASGGTSRIWARSGVNGGTRVNGVTTTSAIVDGETLPLHVVGCRGDAATQRLYRNGRLNAATGVASSTLSTEVFVFKPSTTYADSQIAVIHAGRNLTDSDIATLYAALRTYLAAIGAA